MHKQYRRNGLFCLIAVFYLLVGEAYHVQAQSNLNLNIREKKQALQTCLQNRKDAGLPVSTSLRKELQKARAAGQKKDLIQLNQSLDRALALCNINTSKKSGEPNVKMPLAIHEPAQEMGGGLDGIDARIERYRKGPAFLKFIDRNNRPVSGLDVNVEQTGHEFLFGLNHSFQMWYVLMKKEFGKDSFSHLSSGIKLARFNLDDDKAQLCLDQFYRFANYTSIPVAWPVYEPVRGGINYSLYDRMLNRMKEADIACLAHNLVWNYNTPGWVPLTPGGIIGAVDRRISDFISHFKDRFDYYLVVNEPAQPFRHQLGKDKMAVCYKDPGQVPFVAGRLKMARSTLPEGKFMVNEVAIHPKQGFPQFLSKLKDDSGKPLFDVIGIQSHMHDRLWPMKTVWKVCDIYGRYGVPIHFTEVTVCSGSPVYGNSRGRKSTPEGERKQAQYVVEFYRTLFSHPAVEAVTWWNFSDLWAIKGSPGGLLRADMTPKPVYHKLMDLVYRQWFTKLLHQVSSASGECQVTGFYGSYKVTVTAPGETPQAFEFYLGKKKVNNYTFTVKAGS